MGKMFSPPLLAILLLGCAAPHGNSVRSTMCDGPPYQDWPNNAAKMTMAQWNDHRFTCISHFATFYAKGSDSAAVIGEVVAKWDCEMPIRMTAEAAAREGDQVNTEDALREESKFAAMEDALMTRARGCRSDAK